MAAAAPIRSWAGAVLLPAALVAIWWLWSAGADSFYFPPLQDILTTFDRTWLFERTASDMLPSLQRMLMGLAVAVVLGVAVGIVLGSSPTARRMASPFVELMRATPPPALLPFGIVVLGVGDGMKVFIIAFVCIWPVLLNTMDAVSSLDQVLRDTARVFRLSRRDRLLRVLLPSALPQVFAGTRISLSLSLILMVVSEMVASSNGIGYFVLQSQRTFAIPEMWSGILLLGLLGLAFNLAFTILERRVLRWHRGARAPSTADA